MRVYDTYPGEPDITSPDHTLNSLSRALGGFIGRLVFATTGEGFEGAIQATARAFPSSVKTLHVHGLMPAWRVASYDPAGIASVAQMTEGLDEHRQPRGYEHAVNTGMSDSMNGLYTLADHLGGELMRIWATTANDHGHGLVVVTDNEGLPEPYDQQQDPTARVLRLSGVGVQIAEAQLDLQWHQLAPAA